MKLTDDKKSVEISISGTLSAIEVETLIADLSEVRANMIPPVPFQVQNPGSTNSDLPNVSAQDDPYFSVRLLRDGKIRMWLRNSGLGWMVFDLPVDKACAVRDYLIANTPQTSSGRNLLAKDFGDSDTSH